MQVIEHNPFSVSLYGVHGELSRLFSLMNLELTHGLESVVVVGATKERLFDAKYLERRQKTSVCCLQDLSRQRECLSIQSLCG